MPSSNAKMLNKSLQSQADTVIFDLEDSVAPDQKVAARAQLVDFLQVRREIASFSLSLSHVFADKQSNIT